MKNGFEDLEVWKKSKDLAVGVYLITKKFPKEDLYGITNQIRRASLSIPSNIAEGATRSSKKDFARFVGISHSSCSELKTQIIIANQIGILADKDYNECVDRIGEIGRMLKGLERSLTQNQ